ncbi:GDSL-type esterase/lipase family protein [Hydrotalea sp. AMD]|uniref:SGNH/GDSL hydrolase family protein n=1 Tax=Hydrotalea sp. AMD TaxID=2501297 RepID=UPI0009447237|nr:GDSL-type esterase/lipase family protein [Hydrotalea sp. AMD]
MKPIHQLLCLGDSYTIGEGAPLYDSFPYQLMQLLRQMQIHCNAPEIIAQTGWTSFELAEYLIHHPFSTNYDFVTLLIGVNNQYRNSDIIEFENDYQFLLQKAIHYTGNQPGKVMGIAIPDWGYSPFAARKHATNIEKIHKEIDTLNVICEALCNKAGVHFINIANLTKYIVEEGYFTDDGLHYTATMYRQWAQMIAALIKKLQ